MKGDRILKFGGNIIWRTPKKRKFWWELNLADSPMHL